MCGIVLDIFIYRYTETYNRYKLRNMSDIMHKMLTALTKQEEFVPQSISLAEKKNYLMQNADSVTTEDRKELAELVPTVKKNDSAEGILINLDRLDESVIDQLYNLLSYKISQL